MSRRACVLSVMNKNMHGTNVSAMAFGRAFTTNIDGPTLACAPLRKKVSRTRRGTRFCPCRTPRPLSASASPTRTDSLNAVRPECPPPTTAAGEPVFVQDHASAQGRCPRGSASSSHFHSSTAVSFFTLGMNPFAATGHFVYRSLSERLERTLGT